jgi:hypothetical protein
MRRGMMHNAGRSKFTSDLKKNNTARQSIPKPRMRNRIALQHWNLIHAGSQKTRSVASVFF